MNLFSRIHMLTIVVFLTLGFSDSLLQASPLHDAAQTGDLDKVKQLIAQGADINALDNEYGQTPLSRAAFYKRKEIVKLLIETDAQINAKNKGGEHSTTLGGSLR